LGISSLDDRVGDGCLGPASRNMDEPRLRVFQSRAAEFRGCVGDVLCDVDGTVQAAALSEHIVSVVGGVICGMVVAFAG